MVRAAALESRILSDIRLKAGCTFPSLTRVDIEDAVVADRVLPVLAEWVDVLEEANYRGAIYFIFGLTERGYSWLDAILFT
jgi:hypothetical protein